MPIPVYRSNKGLHLKIAGDPDQRIGDSPAVRRVGVVADDYPGLRPRLAVEAGQIVARGELLFEDRATPGVRYTAPGAGRIVAVERGARRALRSVVIELTAGERGGNPETAALVSFRRKRPADLDAAEIGALLLESGLWTALRTRPFNRVANPATRPQALFVNAMDSEPLAASPAVVIGVAAEDFRLGLALLPRLSAGPTYLCVGAGDDLGDDLDAAVTVARFAGPHPAGTAGLHVHRLCPVDRGRSVWTIGYQDVIALGGLARSGVLPVERTLALAGPALRQPRLVRTRLGASLDELVRDQVDPSDARVISGSVLSGRARSAAATAYLGRYHLQVCALPANLSSAAAPRRGPILPLGRYERVFPFDIPPTFLLRALAAGDLETAEMLGCLELAEEDLALCSHVCPAGNDFGSMLRTVLERIAAESDEESDATAT